MLAPYADLVVSSSLAHHPFCPARGVGLKLSAVFYRLKERCAIFIWQGLNSWLLILRYSRDLDSSHTKALPFQDYFYRYYKTLPYFKQIIFIKANEFLFLHVLYFNQRNTFA
jgi:hypothetical protein